MSRVWYCFFVLLFLFSIESKAQSLKQFNGTFNIQQVTFMGNNQYQMRGQFLDMSNQYVASNAMIGDRILDRGGNMFEILSLTFSGSEINAVATSLDNKNGLLGAGVIFRPSKSGFPLVTNNSDEGVKISALNTTTLAIDNILPEINSGSILPVISANNGEVVFNLGDGSPYKYDNGVWRIISNVPSYYFFPAGAIGDVMRHASQNKYYTYDGSSWNLLNELSSLPKSAKFGDVFYVTTEKKLYMMNDDGEWNNISSSSIPGGTDDDLPSSSEPGDLFFNIDKNTLYVYDAFGKWVEVSTDGSNPTGIINPDPDYIDIKPGTLFFNTADSRLYVFNGTDWSPTDNLLPKGQIYVGNSSNVATPVPVTGDATIATNGIFTINEKAITDKKLDKEFIPLSGFALPVDDILLGDGVTNFKIAYLANPTRSHEAATKGYVDNLFLTPSLLTLKKDNFYVGNATDKAIGTPKSNIPLSGFGPAESIVSLGGNKLTSVATPTTATDAATKGYVDTRITEPNNIRLSLNKFFIGGINQTATEVDKNLIPISGFGAAAAEVSLGNQNIVDLKDPVNPQDATTKNYIDNKEIAADKLLLEEDHLFKGTSTGKAASVPQGTLSISGFGVPLTDVSFGDKVLNNLGAPLVASDAATKGYIDNLLANPDGTLALNPGDFFVGDLNGMAKSTPKYLVPISGFGKAQGPIDMGVMNRINFLQDPIDDQDAATKKYVDEKAANPSSIQLPTDHILVGDGGQAQAILKGAVPISDFGHATGNLELGKDGEAFHKIINLADPTDLQDAATKAYVDSKGINSGEDLPGIADAKPGDIYYNTTDDKLYYFNGTSWLVVGSDGGGSSETPTGDALPADAKAGDVFYNTTDNTLYIFDGKEWVPIGNDAGGNPILNLPENQFYVGNSDNKAQATEKSTIPISGFGAATDTLSLGDGTANFRIANLADPLNAQDAATKAYVDSKGISSGIDVPAAEDSKAGDVFYNSGTNTLYVFNGTDWMPLVNELTEHQFYVGDNSNRPIAVAKENIAISGFGVATDTVFMGNGTDNFRIANLGTPVEEFDAVNKKYVDDATSGITDGFMVRDVYDIDNDGIVDNAALVNSKTVKSDVPDSAVFTDDLVKVGSAGKALYLSEADFEIALDTAGKEEIILKKFDISKFEPIADKAMLGNISGGVASPEALTAGQVKTLLDLSNVDDTRDIDKHVLSATKLDPPLIINGKEYDGTPDFTIDGDNLGNHTASENLKMGDFTISNDGDSGEGLSFDAAGNAVFAQDVTVRSNFYTPSDQRLKTNVETLTEVLASLDQLRGVRFEYIDQKKYMVGPKVGLIAQELQKVYPEMVSKGSDGFLKVDYTQLSAVLIQAVKEQQELLKAQAIEIETLKSRMNKQDAQIEAILKKIEE